MGITKLISYFATMLVSSVGSYMGDTGDSPQIGEQVDQKVTEIADQINESETAQDLSAGILQPIYDAAELIDFSGFYWVAFMLMSAGLVSFLGQLVLGKLLMLTKMHLSPMEILSDSLGLLISAVGLILTTQAATQNSTFTQSPAMVLSAAGVGAFLGFIFYLQGQSQELKAARAKNGGKN